MGIKVLRVRLTSIEHLIEYPRRMIHATTPTMDVASTGKYQMLNARDGQDKGTDTISDGITAPSVFNLTGRIPVFSYLTMSDRVGWYRTIMRFFHQCHREYRYQLTDQEVRDAVRQTFDPEYTLEKCQSDLAALRDWGNLTVTYNSSRATSIASFRSPALLYQATPEAIAIETFLDEQARTITRSGALRQSDLPLLWETLQRLDEELAKVSFGHSDLTEHGEYTRKIAEEWQHAFDAWNGLARDAAQYLANISNNAQQSWSDLEAYHAYKLAVVTYVQSFAHTLSQYSRDIRTLLSRWSVTGKKDRLIEIIALHLVSLALVTESKRTLAELSRDARNQVEALSMWFAEGKNADTFRHNALAEVDKVVRRAAAFANTARPNANYAANLHALALQLLTARDTETAQQLFAVAFANALPIHLPESLAGTPSVADSANEQATWHRKSTVTLPLRPIGRGNRGERILQDPIVDHRLAIRNLKTQHRTQLLEQQQHFARLFSHDTLLDIGIIESITPAERAVLLEVIDSCLSDPYHQYHAPDGSLVTLLNFEEQNYTQLRSFDGSLLLPRYRLQYQRQATNEDGTAEETLTQNYATRP